MFQMATPSRPLTATALPTGLSTGPAAAVDDDPPGVDGVAEPGAAGDVVDRHGLIRRADEEEAAVVGHVEGFDAPTGFGERRDGLECVEIELGDPTGLVTSIEGAVPADGG